MLSRFNFFCYLLTGWLLTCQLFLHAQSWPFRNPKLSPEQRAADLLQRLLPEEKAMLLGYRNEAIPRLQIPAYTWWSEGLHGVARAGDATVFPQAIALASAFDTKLTEEIGDVISTEARAKHNLATARGNYGMYTGLSYWSPNINIFRDPRWGRGQETYGEDPFLTAETGLAFVRGMQGTDPAHFKIAAAAKHFVAHSGPEASRDTFNAIVSDADLHDTYLYAFRKLAMNGVAGIMTAYNRVNGIPNSVNLHLIQQSIRNEWGFRGYMLTDCGALDDVSDTHHYTNNPVETAALAIKAGINLDCSSILQDDIQKAIAQHLLANEDLDSALLPLLLTQIKLGFYDDPDESPYASYGEDSIHNAFHTALAYEAAIESMVLLKNEHQVLPLRTDTLKAVMVVGPQAASSDVLLGNYHGLNSGLITFAEGLAHSLPKGIRLEYDLGAGEKDTQHFGGLWAAGNADITIAIVGLSPVLEGEAGDAFLSESGGDRKNLSLPPSQLAFLKALRQAVHHPIIVVVTGGSAVDIDAIQPYADAILLAWYPGEQGGHALADLLLGKRSPSGRLPVTFYHSVNDLPPFDNYHMQGRTYRYFEGPVQYPFGYGLSYTTFSYKALPWTADTYHTDDTLRASCLLTNAGKYNADEVVQGYIRYPSGKELPLKELKYVKRVSLNPGESKKAEVVIPVNELMKWNSRHQQEELVPGTYTLIIGRNAVEETLAYPFKIR